MADVPRNPDGSYTLYNVNGVTVTLTFPADPVAGFKVVTKDVPGGLPANYTWVLNFGVQNPGGQYLPSASYSLQGTTPPGNKSWVIYYNGQAHAMNGSHTTPGDPPIGYG
jgi:hypothetical protein